MSKSKVKKLVTQSKKSNFTSGNLKIKFCYEKVRTRVIPILKRIEVGDYPAKIGRWYGWSRQHVNYYCNKLADCDLIRRDKRSSAVFYELTSKGKKFLAGCEGTVFSSGVFRLHHCCVKFLIVREGCYPAGDFKQIEMVNWTALLGLEKGVSVKKTTRHWIVQCETVYGKHPGELFSMATNLANRVAQSLMDKYGVVLSVGSIQKGYELAIDDPVAQFLSQYFEVSTDKRKLDHSVGNQGEIDQLSRDSAIEYLLMPERVKKMEGQFHGLSSRVNDLRLERDALHDEISSLKEIVSKLTSVLTGAVAGKNEQKDSQPGVSDPSNYIS
jgi:hypothetical protein